MDFNEVVTEVLSIVKRPDKLSDIQRAVNSAIAYCCSNTNFARDLQERSITIDPALYAQSIALSEFIRFRKFEYMKPSNRNKYITQADPGSIFQQVKHTGNRIVGTELLDRYYIAGDQVNFKLCQTAPSLLVGWFAYPVVLTEAAPTFWLLDVQPYMIIDKAASIVFKNIGDEKSAAQHEADFRLAYLAAAKDLKFGASYG